MSEKDIFCVVKFFIILICQTHKNASINVLLLRKCNHNVDVWVYKKEREVMKNSIGLLLTEVQEFLCSEVNRVFAAIVILCILVCYGQVRTEKAIKSAHNYNMNAQKELMSEIKTNRDKIHFRYFNLTKSLEEIHNVKIDTKNGKLEK